tara:strand:- start:26853 stop:27656 length:804 start_codon:yes stop_codon:yes gene_type:complete
MSVLERNNVTVIGSGAKAMVFAHGFGCDQSMWKYVAPAFERDYTVVLYDLTGAGRSDLSAYDFDAYGDLVEHGRDLTRICDALELDRPIVVGHSVSGITAALAAKADPDRFDRLVMVSPSPCFLNDGDYQGGFDRDDLQPIVDFMQENYLGWAEQLAPTIAGQQADGAAAQMLTQSFCRTDPEIARHFGRTTFMSDRRADMKGVTTPTLIIQCSDDAIAPVSVGKWMQQAIPDAVLAEIDAVGHCPHMTTPDTVIAEIRSFLGAGTT